jgi:carnitine 3-dehydrogenase
MMAAKRIEVLTMKSVTDIQRIAVIGAGMIGASWAALFMAHGLDVVATDIDPAAEGTLRTAVDKAWPDLVALGICNGHVKGKLQFEANLAKCVSNADFVQECAIEREAEKVKLLAEIDRNVRPDVLIASSSSAITITAMQRACKHPERVVLGHPFNPPHLIPLVEIAGGKLTSPEALIRAEAFYKRLGKSTIRLNKEIYGHVANRLQSAVFREAIHLLQSGVASLSDIDKAMTAGPGLRWALMGPFLTYHLAGGAGGMASFMKQFAPMQEKLWGDLGCPAMGADTQRLVTEAMNQSIGAKGVGSFSAERDERILALLAARQTIPTNNS